jgi:hypothetical protein
MLWSYLVKGTFPMYKVPEQKELNIDNEWETEQYEKVVQVRRPHRTNFLVKNAKKSKNRK